MIDYCAAKGIPVQASAKKPYSMDRNLLHISYEAGILEDPWYDSFDPKKNRAYVMYVISGGGYGGSPEGDGLSNGCSTIGISKTTPIEIMEQLYPVLFEEYSLHEGSGGAGEHRGGFGVNYRIRLRRGEACRGGWSGSPWQRSWARSCCCSCRQSSPCSPTWSDSSRSC